MMIEQKGNPRLPGIVFPAGGVAFLGQNNSFWGFG